MTGHSATKPLRHIAADMLEELIDGGCDHSVGICFCDQIDVVEQLRESTEATDPALHDPSASFQARVHEWMLATFDANTVESTTERNHRFLEESVELVQSLGCTREEAHLLVDYVFNRDVGVPAQECGGVMVTLAALCNTRGMRVEDAAEAELARCWKNIDKIRAKQATKPKHSPLPGGLLSLPEFKQSGLPLPGADLAKALRDAADLFRDLAQECADCNFGDGATGHSEDGTHCPGCAAVREAERRARSAAESASPQGSTSCSALPIAAGPLLFQFNSFDHWCDTAARQFRSHGVRGCDVVSVDAKGRVCAIGKHFMKARDEDAFPVRVFAVEPR